jgi:hypothetical protein
MTSEINPRLIALYQPQFHPIPENNEWRGTGFTDWTEVTQATPLFEGHAQPGLPTDLGFYDLRLAEVREAQAKLARDHGIHGFCYYHYWFHGRRLLERPFNEVLAYGQPDFPFCLCWANENWTRHPDGTGEVLLAQTYSEEDDLNHIRWLAVAFRDPRYIRVQGKPLFFVKNLAALPNPARTLEKWRSEARMLGVGELFICNVERRETERGLPGQYKLDGALEFAPDGLLLGSPARVVNGHSLYSYPEYVKKMQAKPNPSYWRFPCVTPGWDNYSRYSRREPGATILQDNTPELYQEWLTAAIHQASLTQGADPVVFVNAWNQWADGCHLEPGRRWGHAWLVATRNALAAGREQHFWSVMVPVGELDAVRLTRALESVLQQDPGQPALQICVVDDGPAEAGVAALVQAIRNGRVTYERTPRRMRPAELWNHCLGLARGRWVHLLSPNDYVLPGFYERLAELARTHPEAKLVAARALAINRENQHIGASQRWPDLEAGGRTLSAFFNDTPPTWSSVVVQKSFYDLQFGFQTNPPDALPFDIWAQTVSTAPGVASSEILAACEPGSFGIPDSRRRAAADLALYDRRNLEFASRHPDHDWHSHNRQLYRAAGRRATAFLRTGQLAAATASLRCCITQLTLPTLRLRRLAAKLYGRLRR